MHSRLSGVSTIPFRSMKWQLGWSLLALLAAVPVVAQEVERLAGHEVAVYNLAGQVDIVRGSGSDVVVRIERGGAEAERLRIETGDLRGRSTLRVIYPDDEIYYPEMGHGSNTTLRVRADGTFSDQGGDRGEPVRIRGRGDGLEAWADLVVEVPASRDVRVFLAVGEIRANALEGDFSLDTGSGRVSAVDIVGSLDVDTGSGQIDVRGVSGDVSLDTGSGSVEISEVSGRAIEVDTGSGGVRGYGLSADVVAVDTGSGSIELETVSARDVTLDTGSGSIDVALTRDVDRLEADTGSGSVTIRAPESLGASVELDTGSGGIDVDFPLKVSSVSRDHVEGRIGDGRGQITVDTGSGSIRLVRLAN